MYLGPAAPVAIGVVVTCRLEMFEELNAQSLLCVSDRGKPIRTARSNVLAVNSITNGCRLIIIRHLPRIPRQYLFLMLQVFIGSDESAVDKLCENLLIIVV